MNALVLVAAGGALGSLLRYVCSTWVMAQVPGAAFPWGTFCVNLLGCAVGGAVAAGAQHTEWLTPTWRLFLFTGILGGFTTFSAFSLETMSLLRGGQFGLAVLYAVGSVVAGVCAMAWVHQICSP